MVRIKTTDDFCCELSLNAASYNLKGINFSELKNSYVAKITSLDVTTKTEQGDIISTQIYEHNNNLNAHANLLIPITNKNNEQDELIEQKANLNDLSTVATTGNYYDLVNKPNIPTKTSDLTNDSNFLSNVDISNKVSKIGDTMTGTLNFNTVIPIYATCDSSDAGIVLKNSNDTTASAPNETQMRSYRAINSDNSILGDLRFIHNTNGSVNTVMSARNYSTGSPITGSLGVYVDNSGKDTLSASSGVKNQLTSMSLPSNRYINLTLNENGNTYTAPANGWYYLNKNGLSGTHISLQNTTKGFQTRSCASSSSDTALAVYIPAQKGDVITVLFTAAGTTNVFKFIYAQGEV